MLHRHRILHLVTGNRRHFGLDHCFDVGMMSYPALLNYLR